VYGEDERNRLKYMPKVKLRRSGSNDGEDDGAPAQQKVIKTIRKSKSTL